MAKNNEKRTLTSIVLEDVRSALEYRSLDAVVETLQFYQDTYGEEGSLYFEFDNLYEYNGNVETVMKLVAERPETDAEYAQRIKEEREANQLNEAQERQEYERLHKLYGNG